jgi:hypothetical protein
MKNIFFSWILILLTGCNGFVQQEKCPYDKGVSGHFLKVPITISPHQITYSVGDTITISTIFSDSIYDLSTKHTFRIREFPFQPLSLLYRFYDGSNWDAGYRVNELIIDTIYRHRYTYSSRYADHYRAITLYENKKYHFVSKVVLKEKGRYILVFSDMFEEHRGVGRDDLNNEAFFTDFEGKCPNFNLRVFCMIEGDNQLDHFMDELVYLDKNVYRDELTSKDTYLGPLGKGSMSVEYNGYFGFEVK